jgi:hypothetical protein
VGNKSVKEWDGSLNLLFRQESQNTNLSKTSVVQFLDKTRSLGFLRLVLGEPEWVEKVQRHWVRDEVTASERRESTWLSSAHVVSSGGLGEPLEESNKENDLPLGGIRKSIPLFWCGTSIGWEWSAIESHWPWEVDSVGLDNVSNEGSHSHTSVLDFGVTQESDGLVVGVAPDANGGKLKRIVVLSLYHEEGQFPACQQVLKKFLTECDYCLSYLQDWVGLLSEGLKVVHSGSIGGRDTASLGRSKGSGRADEEGKGGDLHGVFLI